MPIILEYRYDPLHVRAFLATNRHFVEYTMDLFFHFQSMSSRREDLMATDMPGDKELLSG